MRYAGAVSARATSGIAANESRRKGRVCGATIEKGQERKELFRLGTRPKDVSWNVLRSGGHAQNGGLGARIRRAGSC